MLKTFILPSRMWQVIIVADTGLATHAIPCLIAEQYYPYVFAMPLTWSEQGISARTMPRK